MPTLTIRRLLSITASALLAAGVTAHLSGYTTAGRTWGTSQVTYFVNPSNNTLSPSAVIAAIQQAAAPWSDQTSANIRLVYGGTTNGSSLTFNYKSEVFFRNDSPGYVGEAYRWYDGTGHLVDFDIILHDGSYAFFTGGSGCSGYGIYVENVMVHEFGHGLGLDHSGVAGATMSPAMSSYCDWSQLTLEPDDIEGMESMYPGGSSSSPSPTPSVPTAPSQLGVAMNGSNPTASLLVTWADRSNNETGFRVERSSDGASFTQIAQLNQNAQSFTNSGLSSGTPYYYRVHAFNDGGISAYSNVAAGQTQPLPLAGGPTLTVRGSKAKGVPNVSLTWSGLSSGSVDVYRNGVKVVTTPNDGAHVDSLKKGGGSYSYKVCDSGSTNCSNTASVTF